MRARGTLGALPEVEAFIQARVGKFLGLKQMLVMLRNSQSLSIKSRAEGLLSIQLSLESELNMVLEKIKTYKEGGWQSTLDIADFGARMEKQIKRVSQLRQDAGQVVAPERPLFDLDWKTFAIPAAILAVPFIGMVLRKGK